MRLYRRGAARQTELSRLPIAERKYFDGRQAEASGGGRADFPLATAVARWVIDQKVESEL